MATFPATSRCRSVGGPISPRDGEVVRHQRCARGSHIVIIGTTGLGSMVMRGQLTHSVLQQTLARHGANSSYIMVTQPVNDSSPTALYYSNKLERHFDQVSVRAGRRERIGPLLILRTLPPTAGRRAIGVCADQVLGGVDGRRVPSARRHRAGRLD
tara:strand:+ start:245 stop:712 length:468 start_codon:yes stop_codon:yes gene_type:complete